MIRFLWTLTSYLSNPWLIADVLSSSPPLGYWDADGGYTDAEGNFYEPGAYLDVEDGDFVLEGQVVVVSSKSALRQLRARTLVLCK